MLNIAKMVIFERSGFRPLNCILAETGMIVKGVGEVNANVLTKHKKKTIINLIYNIVII